ncbi:CARDB domain-containing protein [Sorangium sp. So ce145]|uniref:CARDB domain-containing protein n=1 Tax=Sorangium sp. So ce145 TaxID=3133285 RepID=UPI003F5E4DA1
MRLISPLALVSITSAAVAASGCVAPQDDEPLASVAQPAVDAGERQHSPVYVKNWPTTDGRTQWSNVVIVNPSAQPVSVTLVVHPTDGGPRLGVVSKTIAGFATYNAYGDPAWNGIAESDPANHRSLGWIELQSSAPVVASHRITIRDGSTYDAPARLFEDEPFIKSPSTRLLSSYFLKNWPASGNKTQWSNIHVVNPGPVAAHITVKVHRNDGSGVLATLSRTVPATGAWGSYGDAGWLAIPNTDAANTGAYGWVEVTSDQPVVASNRISVRTGATYDAPLFLLDDLAFTPSTSTDLAGSFFLRNVPATGTLTQWSNLVVNNPSPTPTDVVVTVHRTDGGPDLGSFTRTIPAMGAWNAYGDPGWNGIPDSTPGRSIGWVEIHASNPVFGTNRVVLRDGSAPSAPVALLDEEPLVQATENSLFSSLYLKNWPASAGVTQWSSAVVNNPSAYPVTITVRIRRVDGSGSLASFTRTIPAKGWWNASNDPGWTGATETDALNHRSIGWVEINASAPVLGLDRVVLRQGTTADAPVVLLDGTPLAAGARATQDLIAGWISRAPALDYVWGSANPAVEGWPAAGSSVTWRAHVRNRSSAAATAVPYRWSIDGAVAATGTVNVPANGMATVELPWTWTSSRREIAFSIDPDDVVSETHEINNRIAVDSDAISVGLWVEQSVHDYFDDHQRELGAGSNSWEDWAQRQVRMWNEMFAASIYPEAPSGVLDRIRLDKVVVVPDDALPLAGGYPTNNPNLNDRTVDLQWGFPNDASIGTFYGDHATRSSSNPFYYEASLLHELGHARYLVDVYGFNVHVSAGNRIDILENGAPIVGTPYMPYVNSWRDAVRYTPYTGLMNGNGPTVDRHSAVALNLIRGRRATLGNYNAPGNLGAYLNDLPAQNELTVRDASGAALPGASVKIYRAGPGVGWYAKVYDNTADMSLTADAAGKVLLGRCPFSATGGIIHTNNHSNGVAIVRVQSGDRVGYGFIEATDFNLEYWRGRTALGRHELRVALRKQGTAAVSVDELAPTERVSRPLVVKHEVSDLVGQ